MQKYMAITMAVGFGCWGMSAESAMIFRRHLPSEGGKNSGIQLAADLVIDNAGGVDEVDGDYPIEISLNAGYCTSYPPKFQYIKDDGLYYYEFCDHLPIPNYLKMDVHKKPSSGGGVGALVSKQIRPCSYFGTTFLPTAVEDDFCKD